MNLINEILNEYIIASFDTSSDDGSCQLMKKSDIDKICSSLFLFYTTLSHFSYI